MHATELGQYRLLERLGAGGMGEVFLARLEREEGFSKVVVVKRILPEHSRDPRFVSMFTAEARIAASLNHPHIVAVTDFGRIGGDCFLAMEHVDGSDLATFLHVVSDLRCDVPLEFSVAVGLAILRGLDYAHRQQPPVIHADVSPGNVLVGREGEVKLADFGLARLRGTAGVAEAGGVHGKLACMPPEIAIGGQATERSDLFGAGTILYELVSGRPPLDGTLESARRCAVRPLTGIHPALCRIVGRVLSAAPFDRYQSAGEMEEDLVRLVNALGIDPGPRSIGSVISRIMANAGKPAQTAGLTARTLVCDREVKTKRRLSRTWIAAVVIGAALAAGGLLLTHLWTVPQVATPAAGMNEAPAVPSPLPVAVPEIEPGVMRGMSTDPVLVVPRSKIKPSNTPRPVLLSREAASIARPVETAQQNDGQTPPPTVATEVDPPYGLTLETDVSVSCSLDGGPAQDSPLRYTGSLRQPHVVQVTDPLGLKVTLRIEMEADGQAFRMAFQSKPFAILYIDGKPNGLTPKAGVRVERGDRLISLAAQGVPVLVMRLQLR